MDIESQDTALVVSECLLEVPSVVAMAIRNSAIVSAYFDPLPALSLNGDNREGIGIDVVAFSISRSDASERACDECNVTGIRW